MWDPSAFQGLVQSQLDGVVLTPPITDDAKLLADTSLQMSLLNSSPALRQRFDRALAEKPDSVGVLQFSMQFWSTRVHMLRSHATERSQSTGTYNVLSVIKSKSVNGTLMLSLTKEQIELLFRQHPVVQKAYNGDFWERFFHSRLMKKLKGERIQEKDVLDPKLDKYLTYDETMDNQDLLAASIPNFINIEANENNHSQKQGNRPDFTMNPTNYEKAPILRVLNRMSEKMMKEVGMDLLGWMKRHTKSCSCGTYSVQMMTTESFFGYKTRVDSSLPVRACIPLLVLRLTQNVLLHRLFRRCSRIFASLAVTTARS